MIPRKPLQKSKKRLFFSGCDALHQTWLVYHKRRGARHARLATEDADSTHAARSTTDTSRFVSPPRHSPGLRPLSGGRTSQPIS